MTSLDSVCFYCADQNVHRDRSRGITRYTQGLLKYVRSKVSNVSAIVSKSSFQIPDGIEQVTFPFATDNLFGRLMADHFHPFFVPQTANAKLWHYPKGFLPLGPQVKQKRVGTIADVMLQFEADHHPNSRNSLAFTYWLGVLKHSIQRLDVIITVSHFSETEIRRFCDRHHLRCPPIVVTYEGVEIERRSEQRTAKDNFVVHLASKLFYKATTWLLQQWLVLQHSGVELPPLKLIGNVDTDAAQLIEKLRRVELISALPRAELEEAMAQARALLMPSEIEGFGIPAVEAYLLGTPVVYPRETAIQEVLGEDAPGAFSRDPDSLYSALSEALQLSADVIVNRARWLKDQYTWENCGTKTMAAYQLALEQG